MYKNNYFYEKEEDETKKNKEKLPELSFRKYLELKIQLSSINKYILFDSHVFLVISNIRIKSAKVRLTKNTP